MPAEAPVVTAPITTPAVSTPASSGTPAVGEHVDTGQENYIPFTEPDKVKTVQGAEYAESVSPGGLIVLSETQAAPRMSPVAYIPPFQPPKPYAYASYVVSEAIQSTDTKFRSVKMNMLSPEAKVIFNRK